MGAWKLLPDLFKQRVGDLMGRKKAAKGRCGDDPEGLWWRAHPVQAGFCLNRATLRESDVPLALMAKLHLVVAWIDGSLQLLAS